VPFNQTIEVKLTDSLDVSAVYYMVVEVVCTEITTGSADVEYFF
jgi:hypothetical protein